MAHILKFPAQAAKLGYKRVRKRCHTAENPDQLDLFPGPTAEVLQFESALSKFEQALLLDERGDTKAGEMYAKAIAEEDCVADAYCNLGIIESQKGSTSKAFNCFTISLKHDPRHSEAHYNLGNLYFDINDFRLAQVHYEMAREIDPAFPNVYFNLALVQGINNDFDGALKALRQYQELVPDAEGRMAGELLQKLKNSMLAARNTRLGSS
jgi:tetratricopeptide (TPR) repeat protein